MAELDAVRGLALAGLPLVNLALTVGADRYPEPDAVSSFVYHHLVHQRFLTIFCFLFGIGFALLLRSAARRTTKPRSVLVRRLVALFAIGPCQLFVLDGNLQLAVYAVLGLVVLLPLSAFSRRTGLLVAVTLLLASLPITEQDPEHAGSPAKALLEWSGLLALGATTVRYGGHTALARPGRRLQVAFGVAAVLAGALVLLRPDSGTVPGSVLAETALLSTSTAYVTGLVLVLHTRIGSAVSAALAPLGRMALSCFLAQAGAAVAVARFVDVHDWNYATLTFGGTALFVAAQSLACTWWLRRFHHGPVEWLWRCATWLTVVPLRRVGA